MNGTTCFCSISFRCKHNGRLCNKNGLLTGHKQYNTGRTQWHAKPEGWTCKYCQLKFRTRYLLNEHKKQEHTVHVPWNKGLYKYSRISLILRFKKYIPYYSKFTSQGYTKNSASNPYLVGVYK